MEINGEITMEIKILPQDPDGINVSITNIIFDTDDEVFALLKVIREIQESNKINLNDCKKLYEKHFNK